MIQAILLTNNQIIISQSIPKLDDDGEPYYNLMYPYLFTVDSSSKTGFKLTPWLNAVTDITENFRIYPDTIITIKDPKPEIVNHYKKLVLFDEDTAIEQPEEISPETLTPVEYQVVKDSNPQNKEEIVDVDEIYEEEEV
jgi:hypothetical protein